MQKYITTWMRLISRFGNTWHASCVLSKQFCSSRRQVARSLPTTRLSFHDHLLFQRMQFCYASCSLLAPRKKKGTKVTRRSNNMLRSTLKPIKTSDNIGRASASSIHLPHSIPLSRRIRSRSPFYAVNDAPRNSWWKKKPRERDRPQRHTMAWHNESQDKR